MGPRVILGISVAALAGLMATACNGQQPPAHAMSPRASSPAMSPRASSSATQSGEDAVASPVWQTGLNQGYISTTVFLKASTGTGSRVLGTVSLPATASSARFEVWCKGPGSITIPKVFMISPCTGSFGQWTITKGVPKTIVLDIQVAPGTRWAIEGVWSSTAPSP